MKTSKVREAGEDLLRALRKEGTKELEQQIPEKNNSTPEPVFERSTSIHRVRATKRVTTAPT
jgi:hypothetical protein